MNTHYRITAATGGGFFLDFQAPLSGFDNCGGTQVVTTSTSFSLFFTTSATAQNPTQKDLTGPGDYIMAATKMLPFADSLTLGGGITQNPVVSGMAHACGGGTNFDPITLTATVLDTLGISGSQPGLRINLAPSSSGKGGTTAPPSGGKPVVASSSSFPFAVERRDKTFFFSSLLNGEADNFFGSVISSSVLEQSLVLSNVDFSSGSEATIEVVLQGVTLAAHQVAVTLNDQSLGSITFADRQKGTLFLNIPHALLREGQNVVRLARQAGSNDVSLVEVIRITYQHAFKADSDSLFLTASPSQQVSISGFTTPSLLLLDVTDPDQVSGLSASVSLDPSGSYRLSASVVAKIDRRLFAVADTQARQVESLTTDLPSNLRSTSNGANLVIITRSDLIASLGQLKAYRQSRGLSVMIVDVEDVYDEFSFGHKTPFAIREFLQLTQSWKKAPRFVLLAGDGTFDPRNYVGGGSADLVPIKLVETEAMETASDDWYADFDRDGVADIALGRLPVRSSQEVSKITGKIIAFEQGPRFESAMLISDVDRIYDFDAATQDVRRHIPDRVRVDEVSRGQMGDDAARAKILESISAGSTLINYIGHGTLRAWGGGLLTAGDTAGLLNGNRPGLFVLLTCLNGMFQNPDSDSFAEALVRADAGGVAVWASSGLTKLNEQTLMNQELVRQLFAREVSTIGEVVRRAKMHVRDPDIRRTWILFGDPATSVR
jgi:hypothetical protein